MDLADLRQLLDQQSGVVSRRQVLERSGTPLDLRRWLHARDLVELHKGVYLNHTGPPSWSSRAWAGVLRYWPAVLSHESAVRLAGDVVHVAIDAGRRAPAPEPKVKVHRLQDFEARVRLDRSPPVQRYEDALLCTLHGLARPAALELVSEACRSRRTTPLRLREQLTSGHHGNVRDRRWVQGVLDDAADGVQSVLESTFLRRVERPHGLPRGERQVREATEQGTVYRDVRYRGFGVLVELDGRLGHEGFADRASDLTRDLLAAARGGLVTLRIGWHQSEVEPCLTAASLAAVLRQRGWTGHPRSCRPDCPATSVGSAEQIDVV